ncbi:hypothetical protein ACT7C7_30390 [Bacillus cereus]
MSNNDLPDVSSDSNMPNANSSILPPTVNLRSAYIYRANTDAGSAGVQAIPADGFVEFNNTYLSKHINTIDQTSIQVSRAGLYYFSFHLNVLWGISHLVGFRITVNDVPIYTGLTIVEKSEGGLYANSGIIALESDDIVKIQNATEEEVTLVSRIVGRYYKVKANFNMYKIA